MPGAEGPAPSGLLGSAARMLATLLGLLHTRLELLVVELEQEEERLKEAVLLGVAAVFCLSFGLLLLTLFVVVAFWDDNRLLALGSLTVLYFALGAAAVLVLRARSKSRPRPFAATLEEIDKDRERLRAAP
ncbi:MAG: hypothetical protein A3G27_12820 [Betaproteobacteria bacterium RIFCSPLOWO2_12_FULL_66_14]|nr:MAG: hypothetical protein A3G27_12820 [Betaproteobacteria bacterium RIFCSPLOWO2_12_FULL_66_14]